MALVTVLVTDVEGDKSQREFHSAIDAVDAAIAAQVDRHCRVGIDVGEDDGDVALTAASLCELAAVGQILVSPVVRGLVATRRDYEFADTEGGAVELVWTRDTSPPKQLPSVLAKATAATFVGRETELERALQALKEAAAGERRAVFLAGTAGIGKTRLAAEVATRAMTDHDAVVLYGRCEEDLGLPYQPFVEALNGYVRECPDEVLAEFSGHRGADLARIVTALPSRVGELPVAERSDADGQRFLTFEAVVALLSRIGRDTPVALVLEDLHWAGKPTVLLLRHILRSEQAARLLVVGTYRDDELDRGTALTTELADLRRVGGVERIAIRGFDRDGVAALVSAAAGHDLDERAMVLVDALHDETDGNPFYIDEVLTHLVESGVIYRENDRWTSAPGTRIADVGLPESVRDVVGRRIARLSANAARVLTVAAVAGPTFDADVVETAGDFADDEEFVDGLDEAEASGLVHALDGGRYEFDHALIRETLVSGLSSARRARMHRRVGEALEARPDADARIDALAFHFGEAIGGTDIAKAVDYSIRAAARALEQLAYEAALDHVQRGLHALELGNTADRHRVATLHLLHARALQDGPREDAQRAVEALTAAADAAAAAGAVDLLVRSAELMAEETVFGSGSAPAVELCAIALDAIPPGREELRARVLGALAYARATMETATPELEELAASAVTLARQHGDAATRSRALVGQGVTLLAGPDVDGLRAVGEELLEVARAEPEGWIVSWGLRLAGQAALARGDVDGFHHAHAELSRLGTERRTTSAAGWSAAWDGMCATVRGDYDAAEAHAVAIVERGGSHVNYTNAFTAQLFYLRRAQGRLAEVEPILVDAVSTNPGIIGFRVALMVTLADLGRLDEARSQFEVVAADDFKSLPRDLAWSGALTLLCDTCVAVGDAPRGDALTQLLLPYRGQLIVAATGVACPGAADRFLSKLAAIAGRDEDVREFAATAEKLERVLTGL